MVQYSFWKKSIGLGLLLTGLFLTDIALGSVSISLENLLSGLFSDTPSIYSDIIWQFRLPKAITCLLAGAALATGGLLMQTLFRNALAGPDVLGLSSGSSLMVAMVLMIGQAGILQSLSSNPWSLVIAATIGGILVFSIIIMVAQFIKDNTSLLIIGLMISAATSSIVGVLQFISKAEDLQTFMIWSLGNVGSTNWKEIKVLTVVVLIGITISFFLLKSLNSWLLGENYARSLGININRSRFLIVLATGLLAGGVTAFCGPIAFVGLAVPHLIRLMIPTAEHKLLLPSVIIGGPCLLLFCDILSQLPGNTQVLPLNAVTSMIGAPLVIWMVIRNKKVSV